MWASPPTDVPENFQKNCGGVPPPTGGEFPAEGAPPWFLPTPHTGGVGPLRRGLCFWGIGPRGPSPALRLRGGGGGGVGIKCFVGDSTRALCPGGGLRVVTGIGNVQVAFRICRRALCHAVGDDGGLRTGAGGIRGECLRVNTGNDPVFCGPEDRLIEVVAGSNVRKRHGSRLLLWENLPSARACRSRPRG